MNERPCRPHENIDDIDSRAEGPWLGELLAPWAEKDRFRESASYESITDNTLDCRLQIRRCEKSFPR